MAGGLFSRLKNWSGNETLKTIDLNSEFNNIINNLRANQLGPYSYNVSQMQEMKDPGTVGNENLPTHVGEELKELRYQLDAVIGGAQWYSPPPASLADLLTLIQGVAVVPANRIISGRKDSNNQPMFLVPNGAAPTVSLKCASTNFSAYINNTLRNYSVDLSITSLQTAPTSNNTCLVNDAALAGGQTTKTQGEFGTYITINTIGSEITALNGKYAAFKKGTEYFIAEVDTTNNRLKNCFRGVAFDSTDSWLARATLSNTDTITLMKLTWIFATYNSSTAALDLCYNKPTVSYDAPTSPSIGDFWLDLSISQWKKYSGVAWVAQEAVLIGISIQNGTNCVAARSLDFYKGFSSLNTMELEYVDTNKVRTTRWGTKISVYGNTFVFDDTHVQWSMSSDLDSGESDSASTTYYMYVSDLGDKLISSVAPSERKYDLLGQYHPAKPWRCVGEIANDGSSNFTSTSLSITNYHGLALPDGFISTAKLQSSIADNSTVEIASGVVRVKDLGISTAKLAANAVTAAKIANSTITGSQVSDSINLPGSAAQENGKNLVVSNANATKSLAIIRGSLDSSGGVVSGEGWTLSSHPAAGQYILSWTSAFGDAPAIIVTPDNSSGAYIAQVFSVSATGATIQIQNLTPTGQNCAFHFVAIGQRA